MKTLGTATLCVCLLTCSAYADDTLRGGLIGAAIGAIVGHNSSDINSEIAVPAFAAAGALLGSAYHHDRYASYHYASGHDGWDYHYPRHGYRYYPRYYTPRHRYHHARRYYDRDLRYRKRVTKIRKKKQQPIIKPANLHPGIQITIVSVPLANGSTVDFRILETNGRFVGPKGEPYAAMPSAEALAGKYIPENLRAAPASGRAARAEVDNT